MVRSWASPFGIEPWAWGEKRNSPCDHPSSSFTWGSILVENRKTGGKSVCMSNGKKEMWWSGGCNWVDLGCAKLQTCGTYKPNGNLIFGSQDTFQFFHFFLSPQIWRSIEGTHHSNTPFFVSFWQVELPQICVTKKSNKTTKRSTKKGRIWIHEHYYPTDLWKKKTGSKEMEITWNSRSFRNAVEDLSQMESPVSVPWSIKLQTGARRNIIPALLFKFKWLHDYIWLHGWCWHDGSGVHFFVKNWYRDNSHSGTCQFLC